MKEILHIENEGEAIQPVLLIQIGDAYFNFAIVNKDASIVYELAYSLLNQFDTDTFSLITNKYPSLKELQFYEVRVSFSFSNALLSPMATNMDKEAVFKNVVDCFANTTIVTEQIPAWQLTNTYTVPNELWQWLKTQFPIAKFYHRYFFDLKFAAASTSNGTLQVDFYNSGFNLIVSTNSNILLAKNCIYTNADDVLFVLLKACHQFSLSQNDVILQLSGLVEKNSALYKELYLYFNNITFRDAIWQIGSTDFPAHYFTSLNDLATCES